MRPVPSLRSTDSMSDTTPSALSGDTVLKSQVRDFICGCESLLSAIEGGTELSVEELDLTLLSSTQKRFSSLRRRACFTEEERLTVKHAAAQSSPLLQKLRQERKELV